MYCDSQRGRSDILGNSVFPQIVDEEGGLFFQQNVVMAGTGKYFPLSVRVDCHEHPARAEMLDADFDELFLHEVKEPKSRTIACASAPMSLAPAAPGFRISQKIPEDGGGLRPGFAPSV
jgi:hypothetical protein